MLFPECHVTERPVTILITNVTPATPNVYRDQLTMTSTAYARKRDAAPA